MSQKQTNSEAKKRRAVPSDGTVQTNRRAIVSVCVLLVAVVFAVFGQTIHFQFVNFDDDEYVYENPFVVKGLTWAGIRWAFTNYYAANWHPLTWISHMLDCQFYGLNPGGHHFTNVLLHAATVIALFLVLRRMTGFPWRSAFVAAVFAVHPLRVESVAWISERKDILSGLFFVLTVGAYAGYARHRSAARYTLTLLLFVLGLMCKPMLVSLPLVLLLLDYWPLNRFSDLRISQWKELIREKIPFFAAAGASCVVTIFAQAGSIEPVANLPVLLRVENALVSYVIYSGQMFWPSNLAVLYPFSPGGVGLPKALLSLALLSAVTTVAVIIRRRCPYFLTGWLWYLVMLLPVIGIVQVGLQTHADRYTYLPQIGLCLSLTWMVADWCANRSQLRAALAGSSIAILATLIFCARAQAAYWRNSESLWTHTLACTSNNIIAAYNFGNALLKDGKLDDAISQFRMVLRMDSSYAEAHNNLGDALLQKGALDDSISQFQTALQLKPSLAVAHYNLGNARLQQGLLDEAVIQYRDALETNPNDPKVRNNLGNALLKKGAADEAIVQFQSALKIKPDLADAHNNLGNALLQAGNADGAIAQFQQALQLKPNYAEACYDLGNAWAQKGNLDEAIAQFQRALQLKPDYARAHNNLGSLLLQKGEVDDAIIHCQQALQINPDFAEAHNNLANALSRRGRFGEAMTHYQQALQINPDFVGAMNNLAWLFATAPESSLRNGARAIHLAERANELTRDENPQILATLAAAYAEAGRFSEATQTAQRAQQFAATQSNSVLTGAIQEQIKLYQSGLPLRSP